MLRLAICDDEPYVIEKIETYIGEIKDMSIEYEVFFSAEEFCNYEHEMEYDAYILDIELKGMSGIQLAQNIRKTNMSAEIIFLTSHSEYVYDCFEIVTFDFIRKPLNYVKFEKVIRKLSNHILQSKKIFSFIHNKKQCNIFCRDIMYIDKLKRKAMIYTVQNECYESNMSLNDIWDQLDANLFVAIRQGCIVNLNMIVEIEREELKLQDGKILVVARDYKSYVKNRHLNYLNKNL